MNTFNVLKLNDDFNQIIKEGKKKTNSHFIVYFLPSVFFNKIEYSVGISVGKKLGNACFRNYQKRRIRMIIHNNLELVKNNKQMVIIMRPKAKNATFKQLNEKLVELLREIK